MPISLTTSKQTGDLDAAGPYAEVKVIDFRLSSVQEIIELHCQYGNTVSGKWVGGISAGGAKDAYYYVKDDEAGTALAATYTWDGTTTVLSGDTSEVSVDDRIMLDSDDQWFKVTAVTTNVSVTIDAGGLTIPTGATASSRKRMQYTDTVLSLPTSGSELIYDGAARVLYQWLLDEGHYIGTIV